MKVAVAQFSAGMDKAANLQTIGSLASQAAELGAQLVVFPEASMSDFGSPTDDLHGVAEPLDGPFVEGLRQLAVRLGLTIVAGMFEAIPGDHHIYNTAVVVDPLDGLAASYRKRNMFDAFGEVESARIRAGDSELPLVRLDGFQAAVAICYDLRFPAFIGELAERGADLLVLPAAWVAGPLKEEHWSILLRARAIDNTMYVAAACQTGIKYCGRSSIVDPMGMVVAGLAEAPGVAVADVSRERLQAVRSRLPVLAQRQTVKAT